MDNFKNKVRIITEYNDEYIEMLNQAELPNLIITDKNNDANIILGSPPLIAPIVDEFCHLEWMQSAYAGVDSLISSELRQDYQLTNVKGIFGEQISEYVLAYTISHFRHFNTYRTQQSEKLWLPHRYRTVSGKKMLILGTGAIGNYLAKSASSFGLHTIGVNRTGIPPKDSAFADIVHIEQVHDVLAEMDVVVSTLPNTVQTVGIFDQTFFSYCQQALFFNVGRGPSVHTESLLFALQNDNICHAFLDVFINEPISQACPYWLNPKVTVTPHIAACSFPEQVFEIFKENYLLWKSGFSLLNTIDFEKGY
ncbi:D-2-hydroxyacid dehydrogenase [Vibrio sp. DW001]|uniref:D-2-hydroxyacid dehydrogenase n=1 Tax=Vibrio sp. DW001 TaxID=2912315 RepID=UPI0023AE9CBE|nr:D-2-hydroxyacid dehydrogenase [Vibrio sp. DW001]WED26563.1 D-2-hydroxyacid dehydrogenase [Vibrio sp. DW001]